MSFAAWYLCCGAIYLLIAVALTWWIWRKTRGLGSIPKSLIRAAVLSVLFTPQLLDAEFFGVLVPAAMFMLALFEKPPVLHFWRNSPLPIALSLPIVLVLLLAWESWRRRRTPERGGGVENRPDASVSYGPQREKMPWRRIWLLAYVIALGGIGGAVAVALLSDHFVAQCQKTDGGGRVVEAGRHRDYDSTSYSFPWLRIRLGSKIVDVTSPGKSINEEIWEERFRYDRHCRLSLFVEGAVVVFPFVPDADFPSRVQRHVYEQGKWHRAEVLTDEEKAESSTTPPSLDYHVFFLDGKRLGPWWSVRIEGTRELLRVRQVAQFAAVREALAARKHDRNEPRFVSEVDLMKSVAFGLDDASAQLPETQIDRANALKYPFAAPVVERMMVSRDLGRSWTQESLKVLDPTVRSDATLTRELNHPADYPVRPTVRPR